VLTPDYNYYMDVQQSINLALFEQLAAEGVEFAYPTQTVFVSGAAR
jgi:small-conductance mechanosensitive channel